MRLCLNLGFLVGTHLHLETVSLACMPDVVRRIDEELGVVIVLGRTGGVNLDTPGTIDTHTFCDVGQVFASIGIAITETGGLSTLTIAIDHIFLPR